MKTGAVRLRPATARQGSQNLTPRGENKRGEEDDEEDWGQRTVYPGKSVTLQKTFNAKTPRRKDARVLSLEGGDRSLHRLVPGEDHGRDGRIVRFPWRLCAFAPLR